MGPEFLIETNEEGEFNFHFHSTTKENGRQSKGITDVIEALPPVTFQELAVENGSLAYRDGRSGKTYTIALRHLTATASGADSPIKVILAGDMGHEPFEVQGTTGSLRILRDPKRAWPLNLTASALGGTATFKGSMREPFATPGISLDFVIRVPDPKSLSDLAGYRLPVEGPLEISGRGVASGGGTYSLSDLNINLGENRISGSLNVRLDKNEPMISAEIESDRLDLRPVIGHYVKSAKEKTSAPESDRSRKLFPNAPIPPVRLKSSTVALTLRDGKVLMPGFTVHDLSANTTVTGRGMEVDRLSMVIGGGKVNGWVRVEPGANGAKVAARLRSEGVDVAQLSREAGVKKKLGGRLSAEMDLEGNGRTISGLMKKAEGRVVLVSHAAQIDDRYLKILGTEAETSLFHTFNPFREPDGHLEIDCMTAAFDIHGGMAQSRTLSLMSEDTVVIGEGRIDLGAESLDIGLKSYPRKGLAGLAMNPGELMSSFRLEGTLVKPSLALEPADTVLAIGKAVGGFLLLGRLGIVAGMISGTKGATAPCVADLGAFRKDAEVRGKAVE
jgi:hypothetical protein